MHKIAPTIVVANFNHWKKFLSFDIFLVLISD